MNAIKISYTLFNKRYTMINKQLAKQRTFSCLSQNHCLICADGSPKSEHVGEKDPISIMLRKRLFFISVVQTEPLKWELSECSILINMKTTLK